MDILYRFLTLTLRENQTELQLSEMLRNQIYMTQWDRARSMNRLLLLA